MYQAVYKCRLCGESFTGGGTGSENVVVRSMVTLSLNDCTAGAVKGNPIGRYEMHICGNGNFGFADFQGFRKTEE